MLTINIIYVTFFVLLCRTVIVYTNITTVPTPIIRETCTNYSDTFALSVSDYTECSIRSARPIRFCENCAIEYVDAVAAYEIILVSSDENGTCKSRLIDQDTLQLVQTTYNYVVSVWEKGHCKKCYDWNNDNQTVSNTTKTFVTLVDEVNKCIAKYNSSDYTIGEFNGRDVQERKVCVKCMDSYVTLNNFYESIKSNDENICMDIVDMMNDTRSIWSEQLKCWKKETNFDVLFYCATGITAFLPILFYAAVRFVGK